MVGYRIHARPAWTFRRGRFNAALAARVGAYFSRRFSARQTNVHARDALWFALRGLRGATPANGLRCQFDRQRIEPTNALTTAPQTRYNSLPSPAISVEIHAVQIGS